MKVETLHDQPLDCNQPVAGLDRPDGWRYNDPLGKSFAEEVGAKIVDPRRIASKVDRIATLPALATCVATGTVALLVPWRPIDRKGCGMDTSYYLATSSLMFLGIRSTWKFLKAINDRIERRLVAGGPPRTQTSDIARPGKSV